MTREQAIGRIEYVIHTEVKWPGSEETVEALEMAVEALRGQDERAEGEPLTLEQVRQMRGKPVYCPEVGSYGIITMDKIGVFANRPYLSYFRLESEDADVGMDCERDIEGRNTTLYPITCPNCGRKLV